MDTNQIAAAYYQGVMDVANAMASAAGYSGYADGVGGFVHADGRYSDAIGGTWDQTGGWFHPLVGYFDVGGGFTNLLGNYAEPATVAAYVQGAADAVAACSAG